MVTWAPAYLLKHLSGSYASPYPSISPQPSDLSSQQARGVPASERVIPAASTPSPTPAPLVSEPHLPVKAQLQFLWPATSLVGVCGTVPRT